MATDDISVLNDLIETSKDGEQGFRKAADATEDTTLKPLFLLRANDCAGAVRELQDLVQHLGGKPEGRGSVGGALHRGWLDVKSALGKRTDHAILEECEKGEDAAQKRYREALDRELAADVRSVLEDQYQAALQNHERIRALRDQYAAVK